MSNLYPSLKLNYSKIIQKFIIICNFCGNNGNKFLLTSNLKRILCF